MKAEPTQLSSDLVKLSRSSIGSVPHRRSTLRDSDLPHPITSECLSEKSLYSSSCHSALMDWPPCPIHLGEHRDAGSGGLLSSVRNGIFDGSAPLRSAVAGTDLASLPQCPAPHERGDSLCNPTTESCNWLGGSYVDRR